MRRESRRRWQVEFPFFFYSVRPGYETLRGELMQKLLLPLARHHAEAGGQILRHKLLSLADQALDYLRVGSRGGGAGGVGPASIGRAPQGRTAGNGAVARGVFGAGAPMVCHGAGVFVGGAARRAGGIAGAGNCGTGAPLLQVAGRLPALLAAWRAWLQAFLLRELSEVSRGQRPMFCEPLHRAERHLARMLQAFQDRLNAHVQSAPAGLADAT